MEGVVHKLWNRTPSQPPPHHRVGEQFDGQSTYQNYDGVYVSKRWLFDVSTKAVTMETAWFKSLPDAEAPDVQVSLISTEPWPGLTFSTPVC